MLLWPSYLRLKVCLVPSRAWLHLQGIAELTSPDHSATSTFLHSRRLFQGPGLPPSNAVRSHVLDNEQPLPTNYHPARRGTTTFLFRFELPEASPSAIEFGSGLACVRYELRASAGVSWNGENTLVMDSKNIDVVECFDEDFSKDGYGSVTVGEQGKIWAQSRVVGGYMVAGQPACVELQVKNHSSQEVCIILLTVPRP